MFSPLTRALDQLTDPSILRILIGSLLLSAAVFLLLCGVSVYGLHHALAQTGWLAWLAGIAGGAASLLLALWLFLPIAVVIASLFSEPVCRAVERRWYSGLPPPLGASLSSQLWEGLVFGVKVAALSLVSAALALLLPGLGLLLGWAITAWALGRGLFMPVAMRRLSREEANDLYLRNRALVLIQGAALALAGYFPLANLLVPVLGPATMVHAYMRARSVPSRESWG